MRHLMDPYIAVGALTGDAADEIIPGEIDPALVDMSHKGTGIEPIMIVVAEDVDIIEVVQLEFLEPKPVVITKIAGNDRMIEGLPGDKAFELMPGVKALK